MTDGFADRSATYNATELAHLFSMTNSCPDCGPGSILRRLEMAWPTITRGHGKQGKNEGNRILERMGHRKTTSHT